MPILREEPSLFPADLFAEASPELRPRQWWVLYVKARQEKSLARELLALKSPFFLPLVQKTNMIRGRRVISHVPLFAGYLFLLGEEAERVRALTTNRISKVIVVDDQEHLHADLRQIHQLISSGILITAEPRLEPGRRVQVRDGALRGLQGTILSRRGETRLLVKVDFLQRGASIQIEEACLEPID